MQFELLPRIPYDVYRGSDYLCTLHAENKAALDVYVEKRFGSRVTLVQTTEELIAKRSC